MIKFPQTGQYFGERKDFRKAVRNFAEVNQLSYALQGGAYVFPDFFLLLNEKGIAVQETNLEMVPEGKIVVKRMRESQEGESKKSTIPTLDLHDLTIELLDRLKHLFSISEKDDDFYITFGFFLPDLFSTCTDMDEVVAYISEVVTRLKLPTTHMRVRGTEDRPEYLLIG